MKNLIISTILAMLSSLTYASDKCTIVTSTNELNYQLIEAGGMKFENVDTMCELLKEKNAAVYIQTMTQVSDNQTTAFTVLRLFPHDHTVEGQEKEINALTYSNYSFSTYIKDKKGAKEYDVLYSIMMNALQNLSKEEDLLDTMFKQVELLR